MTEIRLGMIADIDLKGVPLAHLIADLLARSADGQKPAEILHFRQSVLELSNQPLPFTLRKFAVADVADNQAGSRMPLGILELPTTFRPE